jgi:hypothetical protein
MRINHKLIYVVTLAMLTGASSCKKGFEEINNPPKNETVLTANAFGLFNNLAKRATEEDYTLAAALFWPQANQQAVQNMSTNIFNYTSSYWNNYYPDLSDYKKLLKFIAAQKEPQTYDNVKYMASILIGAKTLQMLDRYGDIPYSLAARAEEGPEFYRVAYDKQEDVYRSVLADLKLASDNLATGENQINIGASESFLANDFMAWRKFANALRLRYAVRLHNKQQALATEIINDIIGGNKPLPNNQGTADLQKNNFGNWPSLISPALVYTDRLWYAFREKSVSDIRMSSNVWNQMVINNNPNGSGIVDPRCFVWFQTNNDNQWIPQPQSGTPKDGGSPYPNDDTKIRKPIGTDPNNKFSPFNFFLAFDQIYLPYTIITEADVHLLKAEIFQRGLGVAKNIVTAKTEYEAGITSSVNFWYLYAKNSSAWTIKPTDPTPLQITTLLTAPNVLYNGANDADALKKIATQAWLAAMFEPSEAWSIVRRTGLPPKDGAFVPMVVNKLPYPDSESSQNLANWQAATNGATPQAQMQTKVYWMP